MSVIQQIARKKLLERSENPRNSLSVFILKTVNGLLFPENLEYL